MAFDAKQPDPLTVALRFLSYRERTEYEMREKLESKGVYDPQDIDSTINYLIEASYLDDRRFAAQLAGSRLRNKFWGRHKVALDLKRRKIAEEIIKEVVADINDELEVQTAEAALRRWLRKSGIESSSLSQKEFERAFRHLASRGFSAGTAMKILAGHKQP